MPAVSDAETELIVAEVDERRPVRRGSRPDREDAMAKIDAYSTLIERLDQLPVDGEVLATPVQGRQSFFGIRLYTFQISRFTE